MQLKFRRYAGTKGMIFTEKSYGLEAILLATPEEAELIGQFGMWRHSVAMHGDLDLDRYEGHFNQHMQAFTMEKLVQGVKLEVDNMNAIVYAENIMIAAAQSLIRSAQLMATFDGTERVVEVDRDAAALVEAG